MLHDSDATRDKLQATRRALQAFESRREVVGYVRRTATPGWPGTSCRRSNSSSVKPKRGGPPGGALSKQTQLSGEHRSRPTVAVGRRVAAADRPIPSPLRSARAASPPLCVAVVFVKE